MVGMARIMQGNIGEVLSGLETMIREQTQLRREIAAKQSQAKLESTIVSLAPVGFFLAMKLLPWMRGYAQGFYRTLMGQAVLALALVFSVASYFMARRLATQGLTLEIKPVSGPEGLGESSTMGV
jgi:Flp pilus assembly protein TadB